MGIMRILNSRWWGVGAVAVVGSALLAGAAVREAGEAARSASRDTVESLRSRYNELLSKAERQSRHLRYVYRDMTSRDWGDVLSQVKEQGRTLKERLRQAARDRKNQR